MLRRVRQSNLQTNSDFELHSTAVCLARERNDFSRSLQRVLEKRFVSTIARFGSAGTAEEVLNLWRILSTQGEAISAYWAALTHANCDATLDEVLAREMHVIAHEESLAHRVAIRRVQTLEQRIANHIASQAKSKARLDALIAENRALCEALHGARTETLNVRAELENWRSGHVARTFSARQAALECALERAREEAATAQRTLKASIRRFERLQAFPLPRMPVCLPRRDQPEQIAASAAKPPHLQGLRVLCVGGKAALVPQYRTIVENAHGKFIFHDGGIEHNIGRLPALLCACDAVICMAGDCSHAAYRLAKRYCKAKRKLCALIGNSSMSTFARCIGEQLPAVTVPLEKS